MRQATAADVPRIRDFLMAHAATSMFPLSNLDRHGFAGDHPRSVRFWFRDANETVTDVLTVSQEGLVFPQLTTVEPADCLPVLRDIRPKGFLGEAGQVAGLRDAIGAQKAPGLDMHEPHYHLDLKELVMPDITPFSLVPLREVSRRWAEKMRRDFCIEALGYPSVEATEKAKSEIGSYSAADTHRALIQAGEPVAMTGFNSVLPKIVQVGGVYTPPSRRGRGLARAAVALHLAEARAAGVNQAVLSAATEAAARAYVAIGFRQIGEFRVCIWPERQMSHG